jgi:hypothetical protein
MIPSTSTSTTTTTLSHNQIRLDPEDPHSYIRSIQSMEEIRDHIVKTQSVQCKYNSDVTLYERQWDSVVKGTSLEQDGTQQQLDSNYDTPNDCSSFSVMQFNMLAEGLSSGNDVERPFEKCKEVTNLSSAKSLYGGFTSIPHPEIILDFHLRRWRLMEVLLGGAISSSSSSDVHFDVIACEEIDRFHGFFEPLMTVAGYSGLFVPKASSPCTKFGFYSDGCALFWKNDTFELIDSENGVYRDSSQVYLLCTLRHIKTGQIVVFAVTHLKAGKDDENETKRRTQTRILLDEIKSFKSSKGKDFKDDIPTIIMGDFNSDPREDNSCIKYIVSDDAPIPLKSVYQLNSERTGTKHLYTTLKIRGDIVSKRAIDYIFYNAGGENKMKCTHRLSIPNEKDLEPTLLPGFKYPSDHFAVGAKFHLSNDSGMCSN